MTACARIINITSHSILDGLPENSVHDCAQAVAMATKHAKATFLCSKTLVQIQTFRDFFSSNGLCRIANITSHSTVNGLSENSVYVCAQAIAMTTKVMESKYLALN